MEKNKGVVKKREYDRGFTTMANDFLKDPRLSWKAKGLIAYIQSLPENWILNIKDLCNRSTDGRDGIYSGIKELIKYGYCEKTIGRNEDGTISGCCYEICDKAVFEPQTEKPDTVKPETGKPYTAKPFTENPPLINTNSNKDLDVTIKIEPQRNFATQPTTENTLFPNEEKKEEPKEKITLFRNSEVYKLVKCDTDGNPIDYSAFEKKFSTSEFAPVDLIYYFHSVSDWSDQKNMKRTKNGWLATIRNFIRGDMERKKLHFKPEFQEGKPAFDTKGALDYLNGYE